MRWVTHIWSSIRDTWQYRHEPEKLRLLADVYWRALLVVASLVFVSLVSYGGMKFYTLFDEGEETPLLSGGSSGILLLDPGALKATLEGFEARRTRYEFLKKNPPRIADPSR